MTWIGRLVRVANVNHGIQYGCSFLATIPGVQILQHLWSLVERHEHWEEELGCPTPWRNSYVNFPMNHLKGICHLVVLRVQSVICAATSDRPVLVAGRCDGTLPVSGLSMVAVESSIKAIVREALGQPAVREALPLSVLDVLREAVKLPSNLVPVVPPFSGPVLYILIDSEVPGRRKPVGLLHDNE